MSKLNDTDSQTLYRMTKLSYTALIKESKRKYYKNFIDNSNTKCKTV